MLCLDISLSDRNVAGRHGELSMPQELLEGELVPPCSQELDGKGMTKGVWTTVRTVDSGTTSQTPSSASLR